MQHKVYHKDGSLWAKGNIVKGKPDGFWVWLRKEGSKMRSGYFTKGKPRGKWTTFNRQGKIVRVTMMKEL